MSTMEQERVHKAMREMAQGNRAGQRLEWVPESKTIKTIDYGGYHGPRLEVGPSDMKQFGAAAGVTHDYLIR